MISDPFTFPLPLEERNLGLSDSLLASFSKGGVGRILRRLFLIVANDLAGQVIKTVDYSFLTA